jgi:hypothetical protein
VVMARRLNQRRRCELGGRRSPSVLRWWRERGRCLTPALECVEVIGAIQDVCPGCNFRGDLPHQRHRMINPDLN